ncbi:tRNA-dihydrouridine synthase [Candidatus Uhrbacteria bacterium]|nr:tRNA-dihydrouridine synthase [Candidatus Uhrbacteria bacterium]
MTKLGFWQKLKKPILVLAPMANVTDAAFRFIIAKYGKPQVMWTEFVSCDGLCSSGRENLLTDFWFTPKEKPIVAQIFGSRPENFYKTALLCQEMGFDGIDINMGCPDRSVEKQGGGAALIKNPQLAQQIIVETKRGAGPLPVSVKTRIGYNTNILDTWLYALLEAQPAAITIHGRTRKEMSLVPAHWDEIGRAGEIARKYDLSSERTLILGNGDVMTLAQAREKVEQYGIDGVMIGRGIFGNPWLFGDSGGPDSIEEKLKVMLEHTFLYHDIFEGRKNFATMKKHYRAYVNGFDGAKELRAQLMETNTPEQVREIILAKYPKIKFKPLRAAKY